MTSPVIIDESLMLKWKAIEPTVFNVRDCFQYTIRGIPGCTNARGAIVVSGPTMRILNQRLMHPTVQELIFAVGDKAQAY